MKKNYTYLIGIAVLVPMVFGMLRCSTTTRSTQLRKADFNSDWQFALLADTATSFEALPTAWEDVLLPHDWSVSHSFDSVHGDGATAYLPGGRGVYRKNFDLLPQPDHNYYLVFDGVYNHAQVFLNKKLLGIHPYGYSPFFFDISTQLAADGKDNNLVITVDRSRYVDSRWYTGSGIYRDVSLIDVNKLHIPVWGMHVTTPVISMQKAEIKIETEVRNNFTEEKKFTLETKILDRKGTVVGKASQEAVAAANSHSKIILQVEVPTPDLWDINHPNMYIAVTSILQDKNQVDESRVKFGIRHIQFNADKGFFLNGENIKIKGVCLHHDGGLVGAAVPEGVWRRRLLKLKAAGCNAIRTAHNPPSQAFLDLCDELGFIVQEEFFDEWDNPKDKRLNQQERHDDYVSRGYAEDFQQWAKKDLTTTMRRDRNHPCIIQWSIGNEIEWTYPRYAYASGYFNMSWKGNYFWEEPPISPEKIKERYDAFGDEKYVLEKTAHQLADWTRQQDKTRPVVANCILPSVSNISGYTDALDVVGYSYRSILYNYGHKNYPQKPIMGTEDLPQWHEWKSVSERPYIAGLFLWTGIDYMGEAHDKWPKKGSSSGLLDLAGFEKPSYYMYKSLWTKKPMVYIATQQLGKSIFSIDEASGQPVEKVPGSWKKALWGWHDVNDHWNYREGETVIVEVYSNCDEVELFQNDVSLGKKYLANAEDRILKWAVPFTDGELKAVGNMDGRKGKAELHTTGQPVGIRLQGDQTSISANGKDVTHIVAQLIDKNGYPVKHIDKKITFDVDGSVRILGVDNGSNSNVQDFQSNELLTSKGRALMIVQSKKQKGGCAIRAHAAELSSNVLNIKID